MYGEISGNEAIGGILGDTVTSAGVASNSYNKGKIIANASGGGLVGGIRSKIKNCYNSGIIEFKAQNDLVGGLFGGIDTNYVGKEVIENCYYLDSTADKSCGNEEALGGVEEAKAVTSEELKSIYKDLGEEFKENKDGDMYPKLIWE